jgi:hypothetical protein
MKTNPNCCKISLDILSKVIVLGYKPLPVLTKHRSLDYALVANSCTLIGSGFQVLRKFSHFGRSLAIVEETR